jgi:Rho termination factor, N-terminal domain
MEPKQRGIRKKVVAGAAVAVAIPAAVGVAKKIREAADQGELPEAGRPRSRGQTKTKAQLYETAKRLNVEGRSTMTKQQLERAIARAGGE